MEKNLPLSLSAQQFKNPWMLFANGIGDHFLALPAIRGLASVFGGRLSLLCSSADLYAAIPLRRVLETRFHLEDQARCFDARQAATQMTGCDLFIHISSWRSPSLNQLLQLLNPTVTIGFNGDFSVSLPCTEEHVTDEKFALPHLFDPTLSLEAFSYPPLLDAPSLPLEKMRAFKAGMPPEASILCVQLFTKEYKMWPGEKFAALFRQLLTDHPDLVILVVGGGRELAGREALAYSNCDRLHFFGSNNSRSFETSCAAVAVADYFLGIDSVFLHVADLCRIPSVGIFGTTPPTKFGCRFSRHESVIAGSNSVKDIPVSQVYEVLTRLIRENEQIVTLK